MDKFATYDVFFVFRAISDDDQTAWHELHSWITERPDLLENRDLPEDVLRLYAGFYLQFPKLFPHKSKRRKSDDELKNLYLGPVCDSVSTICIPVKYAREVMAFAFGLARGLGVTLFDPNSDHIHRVDGFDEIELSLEGHEVFVSPNLRQICDAIDVMTPRGGPSFAILDRFDKSFTQTAGGDGRYTCEWREYSGESFQHWIAGTSAASQGEVSIPTNGYRVNVNSNECLSAEDVKLIFAAYARQESRPRDWVWRDITERFL